MVVHYKLNDDIQVVGGQLDYSPLKQLPNCFDRVLAAQYFCHQLEMLAENRKIDEARWCFRASLAETRSITEVFPAELPDVSMKKVWDRSDIWCDLENHPLLSVLQKVRNLSVHTAKRLCVIKDHKIIFLPGGEREVASLFISPIPRDSDYKAKDFPRERVEWFNRQATNLPAHYIIQETLFVICVALTNFLIDQADILLLHQQGRASFTKQGQ
jgi:hypothetical protein